MAESKSSLVINAAGAETRVALIENGTIHEYYLERKREKGIVGNIYKGRVSKVLPGMQSAFVDVGLERDGFLYVTDVIDTLETFERMEGGDEDEEGNPEDEDLSDEMYDMAVKIVCGSRRSLSEAFSSSCASTFSSTSESELVLMWRRSTSNNSCLSAAALVRLPLCTSTMPKGALT